MKQIRVLLVEDNNDDVYLMKETLLKAERSSEIPKKFEITAVDSYKKSEKYDKADFDIMLLDLNLPDSGKKETFEKLARDAAEVPVLVFSALQDETTAVEAVAHGAQDYLVKGDVSVRRILFAIEHAIERHRQLVKMQQMAFFDSLTGLYNRRGFNSIAQHHLAYSHRKESKMLLFYIDLDGMKKINDSFGHKEGDQALLDATRVLRQTFRKSDLIARVGGDEFVVLALESEKNSSVAMMHRLRKNIEQTNKRKNSNYILSLSIGVASYSRHVPYTIDEMMNLADNNMYFEKLNKRKQQDTEPPSVVMIEI